MSGISNAHLVANSFPAWIVRSDGLRRIGGSTTKAGGVTAGSGSPNDYPPLALTEVHSPSTGIALASSLLHILVDEK